MRPTVAPATTTIRQDRDRRKRGLLAGLPPAAGWAGPLLRKRIEVSVRREGKIGQNAVSETVSSGWIRGLGRIGGSTQARTGLALSRGL
jgi:hypothetical protein